MEVSRSTGRGVEGFPLDESEQSRSQSLRNQPRVDAAGYQPAGDDPSADALGTSSERNGAGGGGKGSILLLGVES